MITALNDRFLCHDGDSIFDSTDIESLMFKYKVQFVDNITPQIEEYNRFTDVPLRTKETIDEINLDWNIPSEYRDLDVLEYIINQIGQRPAAASTQRQQLRVCEEFVIYENLEMLDVLRALIYIVNMLNQQNCVWGVGRGSSTSSYILYLIGIHDVDCLKYDLDIADFLG